jgi:hypothetical protein
MRRHDGLPSTRTRARGQTIAACASQEAPEKETSDARHP